MLVTDQGTDQAAQTFYFLAVFLNPSKYFTMKARELRMVLIVWLQKRSIEHNRETTQLNPTVATARNRLFAADAAGSIINIQL